jgi:hypothetical protein
LIVSVLVTTDEAPSLSVTCTRMGSSELLVGRPSA